MLLTVAFLYIFALNCESRTGAKVIIYQAPVLSLSGEQKHSVHLREDLKPSFLIKRIVRTGSGLAASYAAIGLDY